MNLLRHKNKITIIYAISVIIDIVIAYIVNQISQETFDFTSIPNIILGILLVIFTVIYIICQILINKEPKKSKNRRLQKAFQENKGYETVVDEIKKCLQKHDYKNAKQLKKFIDYVEKWGVIIQWIHLLEKT